MPLGSFTNKFLSKFLMRFFYKLKKGKPFIKGALI